MVARIVAAVSGAALALVVSVYALVPAINPKFEVMPEFVVHLLIVIGVLATVLLIAIDQTMTEPRSHDGEAAGQSGGVPERRPAAGGPEGRP